MAAHGMKAAKFPIAMTLVLTLAMAAMSLLGLIHIMYFKSASDETASLLPYFIHSALTNLLIVASTALTFAQWIIERRQLVPFRWPSLLAVAGISFLVEIACSLLWAHAYGPFFTWLRASLSGLDFDRRLAAETLISQLLQLILVALRVVLVVSIPLLWLGKSKMPLVPPDHGFRWRAVAIVSLLVWIWTLLLVQTAMVGSPPPMGENLPAIFASLPIGSLGLALPMFFGALWALPKIMPYARPSRLLLTSLLAVTLFTLAMLALAYAAAHAGALFGTFDFSPGLGLMVLTAAIWFLLSIGLAWLAVKLFFRTVRPSQDARLA